MVLPWWANADNNIVVIKTKLSFTSDDVNDVMSIGTQKLPDTNKSRIDPMEIHFFTSSCRLFGGAKDDDDDGMGPTKKEEKIGIRKCATRKTGDGRTGENKHLYRQILQGPRGASVLHLDSFHGCHSIHSLGYRIRAKSFAVLFLYF